MKDFIPEIIGQEKAKKALKVLFENASVTKRLPPIGLIASKGSGKSMIAKAIARNICKTDGTGPRKFIRINAAAYTSMDSFIDGVILPFMNGQEVTLFIDEASELSKKVTMALLTILEDSDDGFAEYQYPGGVLNFDFHKQTFIFGTSEPQKVFHALMSRFKKIELAQYTRDELKEVVIGRLSLLNKFSYDDDAMDDILGVVRTNPRDARKLADEIRDNMLFRKVTNLNGAVWKKIKSSLGVYPLGLTETEIRVLQYLKDRTLVPGGAEGTSLTQLASSLDMTRECVQRDAEKLLLAKNFLAIGIKGRKVTKFGLEYLESLAKNTIV